MSDKPLVTRGPIVRFLRWFVSLRGIRRMVVILVWIIAVVSLFYGIENWRGHKAWRTYHQALLARGEQLDLAALVPPAIPEDQNFASNPIVKSWFDRRAGRSPWEDNFSRVSGKVPDPIKSRSQRQMVDLGAWGKALSSEFNGDEVPPVNLEGDARARAAQELLEELKVSEPMLNELRAASRRSLCRYPVQYDLQDPWGILLPHLAPVKATCERLQLKACAELAAGKPELAKEDTQLLFYMVDTLKTEPFLIAYLVRASCLQTAVQPVWEGVVQHRWNEEQLKSIQTWFEKTDLRREAKKPLDIERAAALWTVDLIRKNFPVRLLPRGWAYKEQLTYCRMFDEQFQATLLDPSAWLIPGEVEKRKAQMEKQLLGKSALSNLLHHKLCAHGLLPALGNLGLRTARAQVSVDQAAIACALERYRLANAHYPDKLDEISPAFMPHIPLDVLTGKPLRYRREGKTGYTLYSVGWNERDDGGTPGRHFQDESGGDWVWQVP